MNHSPACVHVTAIVSAISAHRTEERFVFASSMVSFWETSFNVCPPWLMLRLFVQGARVRVMLYPSRI